MPLNLQGVDLIGAHFDKCIMSDADFSYATLTSVSFAGCDLTGCNFTGATFNETDFSGATLIGTTFSGDLTGIVVTTTPIYYTAPATAESPVTSMVGCTLNFDFLGYDWSVIDLTGATINNIPALLSNNPPPAPVPPAPANLTFAAYRTVFPPGLDLSGMTMIGANLSYADMSLVKFSNGADQANLSYANLDNATLSGANLSGVNLTSASMNTAVLSPASTGEVTNLSGAYMANVVLSSASLQQANLSGALFYGAKATLDGATLDSMVFDGAVMNGVDFSRVALGSSTFNNTQLAGCVFAGPSNTDLSGIAFNGAWLQGANFQAATNVAGASFNGAIFSLGSGSLVLYDPSADPDTYAANWTIATTADSTNFAGATLPDGSTGPPNSTAQLTGPLKFTDTDGSLLAALPVPATDQPASVKESGAKIFAVNNLPLSSTAEIVYFGSGAYSPTDSWAISDSSIIYSILNTTGEKSNPLNVYSLG